MWENRKTINAHFKIHQSLLQLLFQGPYLSVPAITVTIHYLTRFLLRLCVAPVGSSDCLCGVGQCIARVLHICPLAWSQDV